MSAAALTVMLRDQLHKENMTEYVKLKSVFESRSDAVMSPATVIEARPEVPEEAAMNKRELDELNASLNHAIHIENMKPYVRLQDKNRRAEDKQQMDIFRIEMLGACVRQRIHDENIKGCAELKDSYARAEKERKFDMQDENCGQSPSSTSFSSLDETFSVQRSALSMLSASARNRIHNEHIMTYANLKIVDGREAAIVPETSATYLDTDYIPA
jgi:hypothetical protein